MGPPPPFFETPLPSERCNLLSFAGATERHVREGMVQEGVAKEHQPDHEEAPRKLDEGHRDQVDEREVGEGEHDHRPEAQDKVHERAAELPDEREAQEEKEGDQHKPASGKSPAP